MINSNPPLCFKPNPLKCLRVIAQNGEGVLLISYMMMSAIAPCTFAGGCIQGYPKVLTATALAQLWHPDTPVIMGLFDMSSDMRGMAPYFGDPISIKPN